METVGYVVEFVLRTAVRFAPVFFLSIALAAIVRSLPIARVASRWLARREHGSIAGGSLLGAFTPFCSCTVVPVVRSLLVAGAPLAGVMAFWVASPLMDPEIFLFTVGLLGWDLAVARLLAALALSLLAGVGALVAVRRGWLPASLDGRDGTAARTADARVALPVVAGVGGSAGVGGVATLPLTEDPRGDAEPPTADSCCDLPVDSCCDLPVDDCCDLPVDSCCDLPVDSCCDLPVDDGEQVGILQSLRSLDWAVMRRDFRDESWTIGRWLLLAFAIEALILRFVPQEAMVGILGSDAPWAVPLAALLGVPLYLDNLSALPVIAGLLEQGMAPGAAVAFLLAGPVTTIPAMTAVRAVMPGPVFRYYLAVSVVGSMTLGWVAGMLL